MQEVRRKEGGRCEGCGGPNEVAHHYHTKQSSSFLRYDERNLIRLCHRCHFNHHIKCDPAVVNSINWGRGREWVDDLERDRRKPIKADRAYYEAIITKWTDKLNNL